MFIIRLNKTYSPWLRALQRDPGRECLVSSTPSPAPPAFLPSKGENHRVHHHRPLNISNTFAQCVFLFLNVCAFVSIDRSEGQRKR